MIPDITAIRRLSGARFLKGAGSVLNLMPPPRQEDVADPFDLDDSDDEDGIRDAWNEVGRAIQSSADQFGRLIEYGHVDR